jgi:hypothetical protein
MAQRTTAPFTPRFADLKRSLVSPDNEIRLHESWNSLLKALESRTAEIEEAGPTASYFRGLQYKHSP